MIAFPRCLAPFCRRFSQRRGCCLVCYEKLRRAVAAGKTTWQQAEAQGLALPADKAAQRRWSSGRT
jgi:hypothetical protein